MLRLLLTTTAVSPRTFTAVSPLAFAAVLALASPAAAQNAEAGQEYEITIATEEENQYTGQYGQVMIGEIFVMVPEAKVGERYTIMVTAVATNQYSGQRQAACEFKQIGGDKEGNCLPAP
jgi:predicted RNA-binding protein with TRAM domain